MKTRNIVNRKHKSQASSDDWLMTYADMITLLLCFFGLFFSLHPQRKPLPPPPPIIKEGEVLKPSLNPFQLPEIFSGVLPSAKPLPVTPRGERLTRFEMNSAAFFSSGSALLSENGQIILAELATKLRDVRYADYIITVEGHTDDSPINTPSFPSNWELSTARAAAVTRFFLEQGIPAARLRVAGYADTFPKVPNRDHAGNPLPENQAQNRRVIIKMEKIERNYDDEGDEG